MFKGSPLQGSGTSLNYVEIGFRYICMCGSVVFRYLYATHVCAGLLSFDTSMRACMYGSVVFDTCMYGSVAFDTCMYESDVRARGDQRVLRVNMCVC